MRKSIAAVGAVCLTVTGVLAAQAATGQGSAAGGSSCTTGRFSVRDGQVVDSTGNVFVARGVNEMDPNTVDQMLADFPGLNFVRLPVHNLSEGTTNSYSDMIAKLSGKGIVVEIENHTAS